MPRAVPVLRRQRPFVVPALPAQRRHFSRRPVQHCLVCVADAHGRASSAELQPGEFIWTGGDCHLYVNHFEQARTQLAREPCPCRGSRSSAGRIRSSTTGTMTSSSPVTRHIPASRHPSRYEEDPDDETKGPGSIRRAPHAASKSSAQARSQPVSPPSSEHHAHMRRANATRWPDVPGREPLVVVRNSKIHGKRCLRRASYPQGNARDRIPGRADFTRRRRCAVRRKGARRRSHFPVCRGRRDLHRRRRGRQSGAVHQSQM